MDQQRPIASLSFVSAAPDGRLDLWPDHPDVGHAEGNAIGAARAEELIDFMVDRDAPYVLAYVAEAIARRARFGAIEVGFHNRIALETMRAQGSTRARTFRAPGEPLLADLIGSERRAGDIRDRLVLHVNGAA